METQNLCTYLDNYATSSPLVMDTNTVLRKRYQLPSIGRHDLHVRRIQRILALVLFLHVEV